VSAIVTDADPPFASCGTGDASADANPIDRRYGLHGQIRDSVQPMHTPGKPGMVKVAETASSGTCTELIVSIENNGPDAVRQCNPPQVAQTTDRAWPRSAARLEMIVRDALLLRACGYGV
jgi:hypothetical protein